MIRILLSSLKFYWRSHLGVLLGSVLAAAVLTGSLLVGDSVEGSLRKFALQRLGSIQYAMHTPNRFFARDLAEKISKEASAVLQLRGMAIAGEGQVNQVQVLGCDSNLFDFARLNLSLTEHEVALNEKLALALGVQVGEEVSLRIERPGLLSREAPLSSKKQNPTVRGRFTVARILGDDELGRFSLSANQVVPYNAFVSDAWLASRTELVGKADLIAVGGSAPVPDLSKVWHPEDFGLHFRQEGSLLQLESESIYLEPAAARAAMAIPGAQGTLTYLANSISTDSKSTPYSFVMAHQGAELEADEIIINRWLADTLGAGIGDHVSVKYFELTSSNHFEEKERRFKVRQIAEMDDLALERRLAPQFPGLTDVDRCTDWDVGIPMEEEPLEDKANEAYWEQYRQTPKAIVSLKAGQDMWGNRFGNLTSVRWLAGSGIEEAFRKSFNPEAAGFVFQPVREQALASVDNAMDFGQLFVGMSFFLIVAALLLTGLLFVFGVQQRAEEMGILLATGWSQGRVRALFLLEGGTISLVGSSVGAWLGTGYTKLLILGLANYWKGAVANSAIQYFSRSSTIVVGAVASFICAMTAMGMAMWRQAKHPARELLMADFSQEFNVDGASSSDPTQRSRMLHLLWLLPAMAIGIVIYARVSEMESITMPFFGAGALLLVSGMLFCGILFRRMSRLESLLHMNGMALRNVARRRGRSLTAVGLLACGCFLVFAVSSMKEDVTAHADEAWSGTGGFNWFGESTLPINDPLGDIRLRVRDGDDASCLNLNRARVPRLLGVDPGAMSARNAFFAKEDVWHLLKEELPDGAVPALVGDTDTAMWGLEAKTGIEKGDVLGYHDEAGRSFNIKLVGTLPMRLSVFQGTILIAEERFVEKFPSEDGYRMFLMDTPVESRLYDRAGLDVAPAAERLMEFYAVESTYLTMFLVLGALGLAVGSMGMGVVVLRNVQDRRAEIALLRAVGYRTVTLRKLLAIEHGILLVAGLVVGMLASAVAMVPALIVTLSRLPYGLLLGLLCAVGGCGVICMMLAINIALRGDVLKGLRNE